jgi:ubiquinone/menaquinone biosynthesis C-methylase UbiE
MESFTKKQVCRICDYSGIMPTYIAKDNHFGLNEEFFYFECPECLTLQIESIPEDISKYYPQGYYSKFTFTSNPLKDFIKKQWYKSYKSKYNPASALFRLLFGELPFNVWLKRIKIDPNDSVLDVGSGAGILLYHMNLAGFNNLTGIDPFINDSIIYSDELRIIKGNLRDLIEKNKSYKLIIFNYSFEHLENPLDVLVNSRILQNPSDYLILRIPVSKSYAWEKYGTNWSNLDAPRHFHILSEKAVSILAQKSNYKIEQVVYDSTDFQFYLSELYKNGIPYTATKFGSKNPMKDFRHIVSAKAQREFKHLAVKLNSQRKGDQATFYLRAI